MSLAVKPQEPPLRVFLLGRFEVECEGRAIPREAWGRRRPVDLLKLLALAPGRALHREEVCERLWPDKDLETAANNLHRALHDLRSVLGGRWAYLEKGVLRLTPAAWVDVEEFERGLKAGDPTSLEAAVALYRGDLCPDDPYGEALDVRRETLRQKFTDAALQLARGQQAAGQEGAALETLRHVLVVDPICEEAHRGLMRALAQGGRRHEALRQYEVCAAALAERLDAKPSPQTAALHQSILRSELGSRRAASALKAARRVARRLRPPLRLNLIIENQDPTPLGGRHSALAKGWFLPVAKTASGWSHARGERHSHAPASATRLVHCNRPLVTSAGRRWPSLARRFDRRGVVEPPGLSSRAPSGLPLPGPEAPPQKGTCRIEASRARGGHEPPLECFSTLRASSKAQNS